MAHSRTQWRAITITTVIALLLVACQQRSAIVRYEVDGTAGAIAVTYQNATGATEQHNVATGWSMQFSTDRARLVSITAVNRTAQGSVRCRVYVDGTLVQEAESVGGGKRVRCGGLAGVGSVAPSPNATP